MKGLTTERKTSIRSYGVPSRGRELAIIVPSDVICEAGKGIVHQMIGICFHIKNTTVSPKDKSEVCNLREDSLVFLESTYIFHSPCLLRFHKILLRQKTVERHTM